VVFHEAWCILRAGEVLTRIRAAVVVACELRRAPVVPQADGQRRMAVFGADAHGLVVEDLARLGRRAGGSLCTGVLAFAVDAC